MTKEHSNKLKEIFIAENRQLSAYIRSKIDSVDESEDLLQDVYLQLLGNVNVLDSIDNITGWMYTVVKNKIIDWYRRKRPDTVSIDNALDADLQLYDLVADEDIDDLDDDEWEEYAERIRQSIELLPEKQKYVFVEQVLNDKTFRELAEETGEPLNTLIARKRYAVSFLRKQLNLV
ncbi:MAG TPA: RNA polymerase sigma factor [bacterium]|nr:RNA polymerase sigma factor [bacterium]HPN43828.1 RNA polymerase sigma factor [bacterium]